MLKIAAQKSAAAGGWLLSKLPKIELFVAGTLRVPLPGADGSLREPICLSRSERSTLPVGIVTYRIACTGNVKGRKRSIWWLIGWNVTVVVNGRTRFAGRFEPSLLTALEFYQRRRDWGLIYPLKIEFDRNIQ
jgi:hypothetical protein